MHSCSVQCNKIDISIKNLKPSPEMENVECLILRKWSCHIKSYPFAVLEWGGRLTGVSDRDWIFPLLSHSLIYLLLLAINCSLPSNSQSLSQSWWCHNEDSHQKTPKHQHFFKTQAQLNKHETILVPRSLHCGI